MREHYPAFTIAEHGTLQVDEYLGFHPDIFKHTNNHAYINNNVGVSLIGAIPLIIFDPVLDKLEEIGKTKARELAAQQKLDTTYRTKYPLRQKFYKMVKERGLDLRFGASAALTSVLVMAPASALMVVLIFQLFISKGLTTSRAIWYSLLFAFGTPIFFRTAYLNHNMFVMYSTFLSFYFLRKIIDSGTEYSRSHLFLSGIFAGFTIFFDYSGVVPILVLYGYLVYSFHQIKPIGESVKISIPFILGAIPPVLLLLYTQWVMFGNPFLPAQYWMPAVNYTDRGWRGFDLPSLDLYYLNLFGNDYGMFSFGPILLLAFFPKKKSTSLIISSQERGFILTFFVLFVTFCAANQYSRMQFNTGFRFLAPLVPFLFLMSCDFFNRLSDKWLMILTIPAILHSWVLSMEREPVIESWSQFLHEGIMFPWLRVLKLTHPPDHPILSSPFLPLSILILVGFLIYAIWKIKKLPLLEAPVENEK